jgi:uncharacterized membrane protein
MREKRWLRPHRLLIILALSSLVSVGFLLVRFIDTHSLELAFLLWNLILAWLPLIFGIWLLARLRDHPWSSPGNVLLTFLWLGFLPNAFYMVSDLIHLNVSGQISILFDAVLFVSFIWNGFLLGYASLYMIHRELRHRLPAIRADAWIGVVLLLCSFAIYLGRYLRWSSWDVLINPAGVLFDVSDPFVNPTAHPQAFTTTVMFFVLLSSIYVVGYQLIGLARQSPKTAR